jgi:SAM-dependent methyltransferase
MSALSTADSAPARAKGQPGARLAEHLVGLANEAFAFQDPRNRDPSAKAVAEAKPATTPPANYFADVAPPPLHPVHLKNARLVQSREQLLVLLPKGGTCLEIGSRTSGFSRNILSALEPAKLHLCDCDFNSFDDLSFGESIAKGVVEFHSGEPAQFLATQPDRHFDLIHLYIGLCYTEAARALEHAARKIKDTGCIICANYTAFSPKEGVKSGVMRAVNEFCHTSSFEIICLALNSLGCHDVALRRCPKVNCNATGQPAASFLDAPDPLTYLPDVWEHLIEKYQIASVLDVGSGAGWSTKWFADRGIYTLGVEGWQDALEKSQCRGNIVAHDYTAGPFVPSMLLDLAWCAGFVEQIKEEFIPHFMASFRSCRYVCLTHAEPGEAHGLLDR